MTTSTASRTFWTQRLLVRTTIVAIAAFATHNVAWIAHELGGADAWPRALELVYLISLMVWVPAFLLVLYGKRALRSQVLEDERSSALFARAHMAALVIVIVAQIPFFFVAVPSHVLAQVTVTTAIVALFGAYAWLDR